MNVTAQGERLTEKLRLNHTLPKKVHLVKAMFFPVVMYGCESWTIKKASVLWHSTFFIVQHSQPYMTTGKTVALTRQTFVGKVTSLLFNMLFRLVIAFLTKEQASFNFKGAVTIRRDFGAQENKVCHCFHCFFIY